MFELTLLFYLAKGTKLFNIGHLRKSSGNFKHFPNRGFEKSIENHNFSRYKN